MALWTAFLAILLYPGRLVISRMPDMNDEATRLLFHMVNYIFWLTPAIGILIWLVLKFSPINN